MRKPDVIVVGGGPAGSASAIKCSQLGFKTLMVEKGGPDRHKTCGGLLTPQCIDVLANLKLEVPPYVMCIPQTLGVFYIPPSGRTNGGPVADYTLLNLNRDKLDAWLRKEAEGLGTHILYKADFLGMERKKVVTAFVKVGGEIVALSTRYLVGADGAFSTVRRQIYPNTKVEIAAILQEKWRAEGDFEEYFYAFFSDDVAPIYSYVIPKDGHLIVGTGVPDPHHMRAHACIARFKEWLRTEFAFNALCLEERESAAVPYGLPTFGEDSVILVGDAAGFCDHFTGEGIRLAFESGISAGEAIQRAESNHEPLSTLYSERVKSLAEFVHETHKFATSLTDEGREEFIKSELGRI